MFWYKIDLKILQEDLSVFEILLKQVMTLWEVVTELLLGEVA